MTEDQAKAEAAKREKNKSKHLSHKMWRAVQDGDTWKVSLVDTPQEVVRQGRQEARDIFFNGGTVGDFNAVCERMLLAQCQAITDQFEKEDSTLPN